MRMSRDSSGASGPHILEEFQLALQNECRLGGDSLLGHGYRWVASSELRADVGVTSPGGGDETVASIGGHYTT